MVALKGKAINAFLAKPDPAVAAVLIYGPDLGLVRERGGALAKSVVADFSDPFNYLELTDADLKGDPARLADEAGALSFMGGTRAIRVRTTGEAAAKAVAALIDGLDAGALKPNALIIIEAGDLSPRSGVRKAFEKAKHAAALPCYADGPGDVRALAGAMAQEQGLSFETDALDLAVSLLGDDRGLTRAELEKLMLFKGPSKTRRPDDSARISEDDVRTVLVDAIGDVLDDAAAATADGAPAALSLVLHRAAMSGASPIGLLRALQRAFSRLHTAQSFVAAGEPPAAAIKKLRPPVFFKEQRAFEARLRAWPLKRLDTALEMLISAELDAKSTGAPAREIVERTALRLAHMGRR